MDESQRAIGVKLALISAALIVAILSVGIVGIGALRALNENVNDIVDVSANKVQLGEKIQQDLLKITRAGKNTITAQTQGEMDEYAAFIRQTHENLIQRVDLIQKLVDKENSSTIVKFRKKIAEYMAVDKQVREYARLNSNVQARELSDTLARKTFDNAEIELRNIVIASDQVAGEYKIKSADAQLKVVYGTQIQNNMLSILRAERNIILSTNVEEMRGYADRIDVLQNDLFSNRVALQKLTTDGGSFSLDKFARTWDSWSDVYDRVLALTLLNSNVRALNLSTGDARQSFEMLEAALINIGTFYETRFQTDVIATNPAKLAQSGLIIQLSARLLRNVVEYQRAEKNLILVPTQADKDTYMQAMLELEVEIDRRFNRLQEALDTGGEDLDLFYKSKLAFTNYRRHNLQVRKLSRENGNRRAFNLATGEGRQLADASELQLNTIVDGNVALSTESTKQLALANDRMLIVSRMIQDMLAIHRAEKSLILEKTQTGMDSFSDSLELFKIGLQEKLKQLKLLATADELNGLRRFEQSWLDFLAINEQVRVLSRQNGNQLALDLSSGKGRELADQAEVLISDLVTENELSMDTDRDLSNQVFDDNLFLIVATLLLTTTLGGAFSFFMVRNVLAVISKSAEEKDRSQWTKSGQAEMAHVMSGGSGLDELSNRIISALVKYLGGSVGVIYLANDEDTITQVGSYAFSSHKYASKTIKAGEGTVGQAIQDANTIKLSGLPEGYITINSGLGEAAPQHLIVVPIKLEGSVIGAVEIGSFEPFSALQVDFIELVADAIAIAINTAQDQEMLRDLLGESQSKSEQLQAQQEELRSSNDELYDKTESLKKQKSKIEAINVSIRHAQLELKAKAHELELSSTYKSQFLANMSHELRTPLNSMLLLSKGLMADRQGNLDDEQIEDAKIIYEGGQDLLSLINDIMDLSRVEAGMLPVNYDWVEIEPFSDDLKRLFNGFANAKELEFEVDITDKTLESINTDGQRLEQILKNFLSNAFKFTETGKVILRISPYSSSTRPDLQELQNTDLVVFSVTDTGIGIPANKQQQVFEAFQQVDGTTSRKHGGTGLGLSISRELAHLLGGKVLLESEEGEGSCFSLYLPLHPERATEPNQIDRAEQQQTRLAISGVAGSVIERRPSLYIADDRDQIAQGEQSILIIEDDRQIAETLMATVRSSGYQCLAAADGRSGLYLAMEFQPCGILLDMGLSDIDALPVIKQLQYQVRTAGVPLYLTSADDRKDQAIALGAAGYLQKPATREAIEAVLGDIGGLPVKNIRQVLVVEEHQSSQQAIASLFLDSAIDSTTASNVDSATYSSSASKIDFTFASNGKDACKHIKSKQFDGIILGLNLPDMSGFDVLKKVTTNSNNALPPIIIYTGDPLTDDENIHLKEFTDSVIVEVADSAEYLIDKVAMLVHNAVVKGQREEKQPVAILHNDDILFRDTPILLVDDDMRNIYVLSRELQQLGINVVMAENGQVALDKLNEDPSIALVLMDIMMPVMDGYEAMRKMRSVSKFAELPVIALTAKAMPEDRTLCMEAGASEYLTKPVNTEILKSMLRVWLFERS